MKIVIIDNYDSFTYNLYHLINSLGADATVLRNDKFNVCDLERFDKIMISPGPGVPSDTRILNDVIMTYAGRKPIFGVCLGHQAIGKAFGARLENLPCVFHGVATFGTQSGADPVFNGCGRRIAMGRYHSWVVSKEDFPQCLEITAESHDGYIMALRHRKYDIRGIQFHPESVLTPDGGKIISNWLAGR